MAEPIFDKKDQLDRVKAYLIAGESIYAVFDCKGGGTGFVGITDQRVIFYDQAFFTKMKSMVSIPYNRVIGIASADEGMIFAKSTITLLTSAGNYSFEFRGGDKAHAAYSYIMNQILNEEAPQRRG